MNTDKITRIEVIDHSLPAKDTESDTHYGRGRVFTKWDDKIKVELSTQDDGRTLKVFISDRI